MLQKDLFGSVPGHKKCAFCGRYKENSEYNVSKLSRDGLQSYCKECQKTYRFRHPTKEYKKNKKDKFSLELW